MEISKKRRRRCQRLTEKQKKPRNLVNLLKIPEDEEVETVTVYKCKYCGATFSDKDSAISCQKGHKKVISIEDTYYPKITEDESNYPYPNRLMVKFNDGTEKPYVKAR